jgi:aconitate hydratase
MRGTFANIRIRNEIISQTEGGITKCYTNNKQMPIYDAAMEYISQSIPLVIIAGKEYGTGSSRDWAAKGTRLLGVRAVIAESFERIHRSNLIGMGVLPLEFAKGESRKTLSLTGSEKITILEMNMITPNKVMQCEINQENLSYKVDLKCRIDTLKELDYFKAGGILQYVLNTMIAKVS